MPFRRIDIHAHLDFDDYDEDREIVIARALSSGTAFINVGVDIATSRASAEHAKKHDGVWAIVGLHPADNAAEEFDSAAYRALLAEPKVVGIGECGLDYFHGKEGTRARQKDIFLRQIALANETKKPLMLHVRDAYDEALEILSAESKVAGNVHFFAGTKEQAKKFLDLGFTVSFTGVITFAREYSDLVEYVPLDMMQAETDSPFATPVPNRGKRNEPSHVELVIEKISRIKKLSVEEVETALVANAERVWNITLH